MTVPNLREYTQLPVGSIVETDRLGGVRAKLAQLEQGQVGAASALWEAMLRDDKVRGATDSRINTLIGTPLEFRGGDPALVKELAETDDDPGLFHQFFPPAALAELKRWGLGIGLGVGELVWSTDGAAWLFRLKIWHPQYVFWRWDTRSFWMIAWSGAAGEAPLPGAPGASSRLIELPRTDQRVHSDGKWVLYAPYGFEYGWRRGLLEPLAELYLAHRWNRRDFARWGEKNGMPTDLVKVPARARADQKGIEATDNLLARVANRGSEAAIELPQGDTPEASFGVELLEASGVGWQGFEAQSQILEDAIDSLILGRKSTKGTGLDGGKAESGNEAVRADLAQFDARTLSTCLREQALWWWALYNSGDGANAPLPSYQVKPPADAGARADELVKLSTALPALRTQGADIDQLAEAHGVPMLPEGQRPDPNPAPPPVAVVGPDGKPVVAPPEDDDDPGLKALADSIIGAFTSGKVAVDYRDKLAAMAAGRAADELEPDLAALRDAVKAATDYHDLRRRLIAAYKAMRPESLARVIERANLLGNLAGRLNARPAGP